MYECTSRQTLADDGARFTSREGQKACWSDYNEGPCSQGQRYKKEDFGAYNIAIYPCKPNKW